MTTSPPQNPPPAAPAAPPPAPAPAPQPTPVVRQRWVVHYRHSTWANWLGTIVGFLLFLAFLSGGLWWYRWPNSWGAVPLFLFRLTILALVIAGLWWLMWGTRAGRILFGILVFLLVAPLLITLALWLWHGAANVVSDLKESLPQGPAHGSGSGSTVNTQSPENIPNSPGTAAGQNQAQSTAPTSAPVAIGITTANNSTVCQIFRLTGAGDIARDQRLVSFVRAPGNNLYFTDGNASRLPRHRWEVPRVYIGRRPGKADAGFVYDVNVVLTDKSTADQIASEHTSDPNRGYTMDDIDGMFGGSFPTSSVSVVRSSRC